jgi:Txe/YoeB family toxin of Txe-Axe toxin-antitoxin module
MDLVDLYFQKFPDFNFRYNYRTHFMIDVYLKAGEYKKAKPIIERLAENIRQDLVFYTSQKPEILNISYKEDYDLALRTVDILLEDATTNKDEALLKKLQNTFAPFQMKPTDSNSMQPLQQ